MPNNPDEYTPNISDAEIKELERLGKQELPPYVDPAQAIMNEARKKQRRADAPPKKWGLFNRKPPAQAPIIIDGMSKKTD